MSSDATEFHYSVGETQGTIEEELHALGVPYNDEEGPAGSSDNDLYASGYIATTYPYHWYTSATLTADFSAAMPTSQDQPDLAHESNQDLVDVQYAWVDGANKDVPVEHISPSLLTLPVTPSSGPDTATSSSSPPTRTPENAMTHSRGTKRPRSSMESSSDSDDRRSKRTRPTVDDFVDNEVIVPAVAANPNTGAPDSAQQTSEGSLPTANAPVLRSVPSDATDGHSLESTAEVVEPPRRVSKRRNTKKPRRKTTRQDHDDEEYVPPSVVRGKDVCAPPQEVQQLEPSGTETLPKPQAATVGGKVACPVPKCGARFNMAYEMARHLQFVDQSNHLNVQLYCTNDAHGKRPEKHSRPDSLLRHMKMGACMGTGGWDEFLRKANEEGRLARGASSKDQMRLASRTYAKWVMYCRKDQRYLVLGVQNTTYKGLKTLEKLEATLSEEAEIVFRCRCCESSRPTWADRVDNFGCWEWNDKRGILKKKIKKVRLGRGEAGVVSLRDTFLPSPA